VDIYLAGIVGYVAFLVAIGLYRSRSVRTQEDFMVAGRGATWWFLSGTLVCTWIGSGSLFAGAGLAFRSGFSMLWFSVGAWVALAIVYFLADRVRSLSQYTLSDILEQRYNVAARLLGTLTVTVAYLTIAGYQFRGGGRLLHVLTGIDPVLGGAITCAIAVGFTVLAGMVSILAIDLFNGMLMMIGIFLALALAWFGFGHETVASLPPERFEIMGGHDPVWALGISLPVFFLLLGEGSIYQKFSSARDGATARKAVIGMIAGIVLIETALAALVVVGGSKYFGQSPFYTASGAVDLATSETIVLHLARFDLPVFAGVLLLCAAVAIILSTANTFLMVISTNVTRDLYQRFVNPDISPANILRFQRVCIIVLGVTAFVGASFFDTILSMALTAYSMVGAGLTPALLAAFLWRRVTVPGGVASILCGMGVTLAITIANGAMAEPLLDAGYIIIPAAAASILALVIVSLLTAPSPEAKWRPFMRTRQTSLPT